MKKLLIKILVYFLRKLQKPIHREYKISDAEFKRIKHISFVEELEMCRLAHEQIVVNPILTPVEIGTQLNEAYFYSNSNFSVNIKNIPSRFVQEYYFRGSDELKLQILLGGEIEMNEVKDVYDELKAKSYAAAINDKEGETIEIEFFSTPGQSRRITLTNARIVNIDAFNYSRQTEDGLQTATVKIKYETKKIEKF